MQRKTLFFLWVLATGGSQRLAVGTSRVFNCPTTEESDEFVDTGIKSFDVAANLQTVRIRQHSEKAVCIFAKVAKARTNSGPDLDSVNSSSLSRDYQIIPIARSLDGRPWQRSAGKFGASIQIENCDRNRICTIIIPKDKSSMEGKYVLMTFRNEVKSFDEELSRFFMRSTFGPNKSMIKDWKYERNEVGMTRWVDDQVKNVAATRHRVYWRERLDDDTKWINGVDKKMNAAPMHPCSAYSKWRSVTFDHFDYTDSFQVSKLPDGRTLISKDGLPRTVVDKLEVEKNGQEITVQPGTYRIVWRFEGRIGGLVYIKGPGLATAPLRGGNPPLYLPPEIMNDPSYVTAKHSELHKIKMPVDTSNGTFFEFIEPVVAPGGVTGENAIWNGEWSPYKVKEMFRLRQPIDTLDSGCADLDDNRSQNIYALLPGYSTSGRYAPHMNWEMNTPDAPNKDGGWATKELGASWCSNVKPNPFNVEQCTIQTKKTVEGPICAPGNNQQDVVVVCGSEGEVARKPDLSPEEMAFRPFFTDSRFFNRQGNSKTDVWSMIALSAKDQLRQRVAWALSQIFVISEGNLGDGFYYTEAFLNYYDIFVRNAFGNYRDILKEVTFSPLMGEMLTFEGSESSYYIERYSGIKSSEPDENYAREFMQLFTVGLEMLNFDGTVMKRNGKNVPTYDSSDIKTFARAWTGFANPSYRSNYEGDGWRRLNNIDPMEFKSENQGWIAFGRDSFPKADILGGYIGDRYPLCIELPDKQFLRKGATYRFHGSNPISDLDPNPRWWEDHPTWSKKRVDLVLDTLSPLYKKLCNPDPDGTCNFSVVTKLEDNLECHGIECELDVVRSVKIVSNVGDAYIEYVKPPCVEMSFDPINMKTAKNKDFAVCANSKMNNVAFDACCRTPTDRVARHWCKYTGERVSYETSKARCESQPEYPDAQMCSDWHYLDKGHGFQCRFPHFFIIDTYWTSSACKVSIKVNEDGFIALIHDSDTNDSTHFLLDADNKHFFKVHWAESDFPSPSSDCGSLESCVSIDNYCHCDVEVTVTQVFQKKPSSASEIISKLNVGGPDPFSFDAGEYSTTIIKGSDGFTIHHKKGNKKFNEETLFGLKYHGKQIYLKNERSTIEIGGRYSFRNPPHFLNLLNPVERDAYHEVEAIFDHFLYHPNTSVYVALQLIKRFGTSNPTPAYVERVVNAFRTGKYRSNKANIEFGDEHYGNLGATVAAVILDEEVLTITADADPTSGSLREPTLSMFAFMRAMDMTQVPWAPQLELNWSTSGNMPFNAPSIFGFFLSEYAEPGQIEQAGLTSPEASWFNAFHSVKMLSGFKSLIELGLTWCYGGWGGRTTVYDWTCKEYDKQFKQNEVSRAHLKHKAPSGASTEEIVDELDMLLTAGRMNKISREKIEEAYEAELLATGNNLAALRLAQRLFILSPEFHSTGIFRMHETVSRQNFSPPDPTDGQNYKSIVILYLNGGIDGFNMLVPHSNCNGGADMFAEYEAVRTFNALKKEELLPIDTSESNQVCEIFGLHPAMPFLQRLYNDGDLSFLANIGLLNELCDKHDYKVKTNMLLGSHNTQRLDVLRNDINDEHPGKGASGRILDALQKEGFKVHGISVGDGGKLNLAAYNASHVEVDRFGGLMDFGIPFVSRRDDLLAALNKESMLGSSMFGEIWSDGLQSGLQEYEMLKETLQTAKTDTKYPDSHYGTQLGTIAKMINTASVRGYEREVFFTEVYGWDHHFDVGPAMRANLGAVDKAMKAFVTDLKKQGRWDDTVVLALSDFGRTLRINGNKGTDHGWANNYFITGGAVKGGKIFGSYPDRLADEDSEYIFRGIPIPTTPLDSAWNAIAEWMGVTSDAGMRLAVPNMRSFPADFAWDKDTLFKMYPETVHSEL